MKQLLFSRMIQVHVTQVRIRQVHVTGVRLVQSSTMQMTRSPICDPGLMTENVRQAPCGAPSSVPPVQPSRSPKPETSERLSQPRGAKGQVTLSVIGVAGVALGQQKTTTEMFLQFLTHGEDSL